MENQTIRTFGRTHGKKLSARQQWLVENLLPTLSPTQTLTTNTDTILEIGFGAGEHLRELALAHPAATIIGAEPFINGVASLLSQIAISKEQIANVRPEYKNIRIWADDVRKLLIANCYLLNAIYILHPDPWPKARHEKRRLLSAEFLTLLSKHLAQSGQIIIGTDHYDYYDWIVEQVKKTKLRITNYDLRIIETRYQQKNKAGTVAPKYLILSN